MLMKADALSAASIMLPEAGMQHTSTMRSEQCMHCQTGGEEQWPGQAAAKGATAKGQGGASTPHKAKG